MRHTHPPRRSLADCAEKNAIKRTYRSGTSCFPRTSYRDQLIPSDAEIICPQMMGDCVCVFVLGGWGGARCTSLSGKTNSFLPGTTPPRHCGKRYKSAAATPEDVRRRRKRRKRKGRKKSKGRRKKRKKRKGRRMKRTKRAGSGGGRGRVGEGRRGR